MKRKYLIFAVLILVFTPLMNVPTVGAATWGVETDTEYEFQLLLFSFADTDYTKFIKAQFNVYVKFTELNNTGYTYDVYNSTTDELISSNSTNFESVETENGTFITPIGLPIALPLLYDSTNYLEYVGQIVNQSSSIFGEFGVLSNTTMLDNDTSIEIYSTLGTDYLTMYANLYTPKVNESLLEALSEGLGEGGGLPLQIPTNITDFKLNVTVSYNATIGIFNDITIKIRSTATDDFGYESPFNIDFKYAWDAPKPPSPPSTTDDDTEPTEDTPYPWILAFTTPLVIVSLMALVRKRRS
ncbi:MAG: hypothetical protein ACTSQE_09805 [Candidatus Heimdallarchaeaceae archaeon]